jgi:hypothetical protein
MVGQWLGLYGPNERVPGWVRREIEEDVSYSIERGMYDYRRGNVENAWRNVW